MTEAVVMQTCPPWLSRLLVRNVPGLAVGIYTASVAHERRSVDEAGCVQPRVWCWGWYKLVHIFLCVETHPGCQWRWDNLCGCSLCPGVVPVRLLKLTQVLCIFFLPRWLVPLMVVSACGNSSLIHLFLSVPPSQALVTHTLRRSKASPFPRLLCGNTVVFHKITLSWQRQDLNL